MRLLGYTFSRNLRRSMGLEAILRIDDPHNTILLVQSFVQSRDLSHRLLMARRIGLAPDTQAMLRRASEADIALLEHLTSNTVIALKHYQECDDIPETVVRTFISEQLAIIRKKYKPLFTVENPSKLH